MTRIACIATATKIASPAQSAEGMYIDRQRKDALAPARSREQDVCNYGGKKSDATLLVARLHAELSRISRLPSNWDREGARRISARSAESAWEFARLIPQHLLPVPRVVPTADGHVQFEWHAGEVSLEIEFDDYGSAHYLKWDPANNIEDDGDLAEASSRENVLRWFAERQRNVDR